MCSLVSMSLLVGTTSAQTPTIVPQRGHTSSVEAVAFNEAGNLLATAGSDKVILWDVSSGLMWTSIDVPLAAGTSLVGFASGDQLVFSVNSFGIHAYDTHTRALKWERQDGATSSAASSFANRLVYAVGSASQGDLKVVDTRDGHDVRLIHTAVTVPTISLSADASLLAVGSRHGANALGTNPIKGAPDHRLAIYDVQTGLVKFELSTESSWCSTVAFSPNGDLLAAVTYEKVPPAVNSYGNVVLQVWRLTDRTVHIRVPLPYKYSLGSALSFEKKGDRLALAVAGNDVPRGKSMFVVDSAGQLQPMESPIDSVWHLSYSERDAIWAGGGAAPAIGLWDAHLAVPIGRLASYTAKMDAAILSGSGDQLLLGTDRGQAQAIDLRLGIGKTLPLRDVVAADDGDTIAGFARSLDHAVAYSLRTGTVKLRTDTKAIGESVITVAIDKSGRYLIEAILRDKRDSSRIEVWDISTHAKLFVVDRQGYTRRLQVLPGGDVLMIEDASGVTLWRLSTRNKLIDIADAAEVAFVSVSATTDSVTRAVARNASKGTKYGLIVLDARGDHVETRRADSVPDFLQAVGPGSLILSSQGFPLQRVFYDWQSRRSTPLDYILLDGRGNVFKRGSAVERYTTVDAVTGKPYEGSLDDLRLPTVDHHVFTPDGKKYLAMTSTGDIVIWSTDTGRFEGLLRGNGTKIASWSFSNNGQRLVIATNLGEALLWNLETGTRTATFLSLDEGDWLAIGADGRHFFGTKTAEVKVAYRVGDRAVPFEQFELRYNRPDIVLSDIGVAPPERIAAAKEAYLARLERMHLDPSALDATAADDTPLPELDVDTKFLSLTTTETNVTLPVKVSGRQGVPVRLNVYDNDVPAFGSAGVPLNGVTSTVLQVPLSVGGNFIVLSAIDEAGNESLRQSFRVVRIDSSSRKPKLFVMALGISNYLNKDLNLRYGATDARDVVAAFAALKGFGSVEPLPLTDAEVTGDVIDRMRTFLAKASVDDEVVVFLSGHGVRDPNGNYRFVPYDFDPNDPSKWGITYDELEDVLDGVSARRKLLFLDTCFAGEADTTDPISRSGVTTRGAAAAGSESLSEEWRAYALLDQLVDLRRGSGATVIAASRAYDPSYDRLDFLKLERGIFATALIEGLTERDADANSDGALTVSELRDFVNTRVEKLSHGLEQPVVRRESIRYDFQIK